MFPPLPLWVQVHRCRLLHHVLPRCLLAPTPNVWTLRFRCVQPSWLCVPSSGSAVFCLDCGLSTAYFLPLAHQTQCSECDSGFRDMIWCESCRTCTCYELPMLFPLACCTFSSVTKQMRHLHPRDDQRSAFPVNCRLPKASICKTGSDSAWLCLL